MIRAAGAAEDLPTWFSVEWRSADVPILAWLEPARLAGTVKELLHFRISKEGQLALSKSRIVEIESMETGSRLCISGWLLRTGNSGTT